MRAHGHVVSWNVNGQDHAGFNPSWPPEYGRTASRPTDNRDQGGSFGLYRSFILEGRVN